MSIFSLSINFYDTPLKWLRQVPLPSVFYLRIMINRTNQVKLSGITIWYYGDTGDEKMKKCINFCVLQNVFCTDRICFTHNWFLERIEVKVKTRASKQRDWEFV